MPSDQTQRDRRARRRNIVKGRLSREAKRTRRPNSADAMRRLQEVGQRDYTPVVPSPLGTKSCSIDSVPTPTPSEAAPSRDPTPPPPVPTPPVPTPPGLPARRGVFDWEAWYRGDDGPQPGAFGDDISRSMRELLADTEPDDEPVRPVRPDTCGPLVPIGLHRSASGSSMSNDARFAEFEAAAAAYVASVNSQALSMRGAPASSGAPSHAPKYSYNGMRRNLVQKHDEKKYIDPQKLLLSSSVQEPEPRSSDDRMDPQQEPKGSDRG